MNRLNNFNYIEDKLNYLAYRIESRGGLNLLELNLHSENFYLHFLNLLFDWDLKNLNSEKQNVAGIDLVDTKNNIIIQVSATASKQKIESALAKDLSQYRGFCFKFIAISKNASSLRLNKYINPHNLEFTPAKDIYDVSGLLKIILGMNITRQAAIYDFLEKELKHEPDPQKMESNLTSIINVLSKEDWNLKKVGFEVDSYSIEDKISYNQLDQAKTIIDDFKIHYSRIDKIYSEYDKQGSNKSQSILNGIRSEYIDWAVNSVITPDQCFLKIIDSVIKKIKKSANYIHIPEEELELCVQILVVDAFIRCKIFKNPMENIHANP